MQGRFTNVAEHGSSREAPLSAPYVATASSRGCNEARQVTTGSEEFAGFR